MYSFGKKSQEQLNTCHEDIQKILNELIKYYDFSVLEGIRTTERQQELFKIGNTTLDGINQLSKHQHPSGKSHAVDIIPYKKGFDPFENTEDNWRRYFFMMGQVYAIANKLLEAGEISHRVRFGIDWQMDMVYNNKKEFFDAPHFELI